MNKIKYIKHTSKNCNNIEKCLFCEISKGNISSNKVFDNNNIYAFLDINPQAPIHIIIVPKQHIDSLSIVSEEHIEILGMIQIYISKIAKQFDELKNGFRVVNNCGIYGGQTIYHLHYHLLGGKQLNWPPG
ncbi:MAG: HIT domain-containing protein [Endomicrobium sp.]|nr:HIT domain-containing protein [Endomicrobium sp.]